MTRVNECRWSKAGVRIEEYGALFSLPTQQGINRDVYVCMSSLLRPCSTLTNIDRHTYKIETLGLFKIWYRCKSYFHVKFQVSGTAGRMYPISFSVTAISILCNHCILCLYLNQDFDFFIAALQYSNWLMKVTFTAMPVLKTSSFFKLDVFFTAFRNTRK